MVILTPHYSRDEYTPNIVKEARAAAKAQKAGTRVSMLDGPGCPFANQYAEGFCGFDCPDCWGEYMYGDKAAEVISGPIDRKRAWQERLKRITTVEALREQRQRLYSAVKIAKNVASRREKKIQGLATLDWLESLTGEKLPKNEATALAAYRWLKASVEDDRFDPNLAGELT